MTPIATFYRAKSAEFSAENAIFDMNLMATQLGTAKKVASASSKITAPAMESFTYGSGTYSLKHIPKVAPNEIYVLNGDSTFGKKYFKRGIVKTKNRNDRLVKEILTNNNLQNYMIHYLAEKIYEEANR